MYSPQYGVLNKMHDSVCLRVRLIESWRSWLVAPPLSGNTTFRTHRANPVTQCPEHVYCEQHISKNTAHAFCIRQYASFKDAFHLYFLFDLMSGGDLMDVLVAEAKIIKHSVPQGGEVREGPGAMMA